jgi:hypothetical protein
MKLPFILLLDIDQTLVGNVDPVFDEFTILEHIYKNCISTTREFPNSCNTVRGRAFDIQEELKNGLLRPHCKEFLAFCKKKFKTLEVFFYTNSSHTWARTGIAPQIEKAIGMKFNRPIFTYEYSIGYTKTVANIAHDIYKSLVKKYPAISNKDAFVKVLNERFIFIDDIKDNLHDYKERQIVCPEYNFLPYYDIYDKLINKYKIEPSVFDNKELLELLYKYRIPVYNKNGSIYQQNKDLVELWRLYLSKTREVENKNEPFKDDTFFLDMIKIFEKIEDFTDNRIKIINKKFAKST